MSRPPPMNGPSNGYRNGSNPSLAPTTSSQGQGRAITMSRAERFEDEKRRIIESCFSKLDQNGQLAESYITHIRIHEDAVHPSSPPPPDSPESNKKPRLIIIAVRSTGRVRMHKARENNNGSFSIGKTWNMEELSAIESFNSPLPPQSEREAQHRQWAGSVGFTVTITKPYYWQAGTAKEKEFFIASAVKIYRKYTKGQVPELKGFDEQQKSSMTGIPPGQPLPPPQPVPMPQAPPSPHQAPAPPQPPFAARPQSRENSQYRGSPGPPPSMSDRDQRAPSQSSNRHPSEGRHPSESRQPSESSSRFAPPPNQSIPKPFASQEHLRSSSREAHRQDSRPGTSPGPSGTRAPRPPVGQMPPPPSQQSSHSNLRAESPANLSVSSGAPPYRSQSPNIEPRPQRSMDSYQEDRRMGRSPPPANGEMLPPPQQRFQQQQRPQSPLTPRQPPPVSPHQRPVSPAAPQLPPIETSYSNDSKEHARNQTADSELSSAGFDPAALASLTGFQGPEHNFANAPPPAIEEPSSPPTPEKSKKRQPKDFNRTDSTTSDLRPAPLTQRTRPAENGSAYATPNEGTPRHEEPAPELKPQPLSPTRKQSEGSQPMPGGFQSTPAAPSPAETSQEEKKEEPKSEEVPSPEPEDEFRPGLGPMIKKRAVADRFKKAANTANAFHPRKGGAAEKILKAKAEREANAPVAPDGITSVVPRPSTATKQEEPAPAQPDDLSVKAPAQDDTPKIDVSSPMSPARGLDGDMDGAARHELRDESPNLQTPDQQARQEELEGAEKERQEQRAVRKPQVKVKRRSASEEQKIAALGIDPALLKDRCLDFEQMLDDFGWADAALSTKAVAEMEASLRREQTRLEAGTWLANPEHDAALQEKVGQVANCLDKAIEECDDMDKLLTIYNMELATLNDDVAYIEAQSQGLQVQAANQRLLHQELNGLLQTISLDKRVLEPLRRADLSENIGIEETEQSLVKLYKAMTTIDPHIRSTSSGRPKSRGGLNEGNEMSSMRALQQKRDSFERESNGFCQRLMQHLDHTFSSTFGNAENRVMRPTSGASGAHRINTDAFYEARKGLWVFSPLILFTKELNSPAWQTILRMYHGHAKQMYMNSFKQNFSGWRTAGRKPSGEELEILFTATEKDEGQDKGALSSARKLTVKRSHTLAKTLRNASGGDKGGAADSRSTGSMMYCEVFAGAMDETAPLLNQEQNFIVDFFHATSLESSDFMDAVASTAPENRYGTNLIEKKPTEPDREMARCVTGSMDELFSFIKSEFNTLVDWSVSLDPIQGVGVMACLCRHAYYLAESNQEFLVQLMEGLTARLQALFSKFVDEQIRAIEDTKVKIKKRKGVIAFMKTFPHFSAGVENVFATVGGNDYEARADCLADVRQRVDGAYARINRAMFDSLKVIAKEGPAAPGGGQQAAVAHGDDSQQEKEMLNYEVLIIENMHHYVEEVDDGGRQEGVLAEWRGKAMNDRAEAMEAYVARVVRRPLGKLLDFLDSLAAQQSAHPSAPPTSITARANFTRKAARSVLSAYDSKEIRMGIAKLKERINKHFSGEEQEALSRALVGMVYKECEGYYERVLGRVKDAVREYYPNVEGEKEVVNGFEKGDVQQGFRR